MRRKIKVQFLFIVISIVLIPVLVHSVSLGSFVRKDSTSINNGDKATFEILFWNLGDPYYLKISEKNIPTGWKVSVKPNNFLLETSEPENPPFDKGRYISLPEIGTIKANVVMIEIQTSSKTKKGNYDVNLVASTSLPSKRISVSQERDINFRIKLLNGGQGDEESGEKEGETEQMTQPGKETNLGTNQEKILETSSETNIDNKTQEEKSKNPLTGKVVSILSSTLKNQNLIILFGIIFTILGCVVIYKYA